MPDLFDSEPAGDVDPLAGKIDELKSKGVDELAKGKAHADQFIDFLKEQNGKVIEDFTKLKEENDRLKAERALQSVRQEPVEKEPVTTGFDPDKVRSLAKEVMEQDSKERVLANNLNAVADEVQKKYGDKSKEWMVSKSAEVGLSLDELKALAAKSPNAFFALVGIAGHVAASPAPSQGTVRSDAIASSQPSVGTFAAYEALRKKDSATYWSPKVQQQMFKDRVRLGSENFYKKG